MVKNHCYDLTSGWWPFFQWRFPWPVPKGIQRGSWKVKYSGSWATDWFSSSYPLQAIWLLFRAQQEIGGKKLQTVPSPRSPGRYSLDWSMYFIHRETLNLKKTKTIFSNLAHSRGMPWQTGVSSRIGDLAVGLFSSQGLMFSSHRFCVGPLGIVSKR